MAGLIIFTFIPMTSSFVLSFFRWNLLSPPQFKGVANYLELLKNPIFWSSLKHTLYFICGYIPVVLLTGFIAAVFMNQKIKGLAFFRAAFFIPVISSWVSISLLWMWILNPKFGLVNFLLALVGIDGPAWLFDPAWAMPAVIATSVWKDTGYIMIILLGGLQDISPVYYEAASIDGANFRAKLTKITLPLLTPTIFFALIISLINSFQVFEQVWVMTGGGPAGSTSVLVEQIYKNAASYNRMGYASALSWVLFLFVFIVTRVQFRLQKRWVHYG
ncbi:MAG: sugar ABC transporter permease [Spirochaetales bacterium]|nr:sugar ABC transporter permease [Spirochaetales bacterium]